MSGRDHAKNDPFPILRIDHLEFYVGNAKQSAAFYRDGFGFLKTAYSGMETGDHDVASYVLEQGNIRFVVSAATVREHAVAEHAHRHGDGVAVIALQVPDAQQAYEFTTSRGACGVTPLTSDSDEHGELRYSIIQGYGDTRFKFVDRSSYAGVFAPGYEAREAPEGEKHKGIGLSAIDHIVGNVELGAMNQWVKFFEETMGFSLLLHFDDKDISTEYSALMSKVVQDGSGKIKFPINEPADGRRKSQIQEYLDYYGGPGVQHVALITGDIVSTVQELRRRGIEFLRVPSTYYENLRERVGEIKESVDEIAELNILVDRDEEGYLLQIFTKPVEDIPTLFFEIIQRHGSRGFGVGNFKSLFEAIELEQQLRGNLEMPFYDKRGEIPAKRHVQFRSPGGDLYHEELMGLAGFSGSQSLLYHLRAPTNVRTVERLGSTDLEFESPGPLKHRLLNTLSAAPSGDAVEGRVPLMANQDVAISLVRPVEPMSYWYRFAHGDEVIFVHEGDGELESQFGTLRYRPGDYLVIPTGVMWRILPAQGSPQRMLVVEATGHIEPPQRYLNRAGQFLEHSPYCERDLRGPELPAPNDSTGDFEVRVKSRDQITSFRYDFHPLDVIGWDGCLWPYAFNIEDFEPITGRVHQPPPVHQTFEGPGFVICSFVPRLFDYHPEAIPAPYNHSNVDSDEVLYYVDGNFMSRKGIDSGSISIHPNGIPHGPHPGTYEGSIGKKDTNELAVMVDTFRPLRVTRQAAPFEDVDYYQSWR